MWFWIFMLLVDLLTPLTMIGFGKYFSKKVPQEINGVFGYRTSMSMKNRDTWEFAHKYLGKIWSISGWIMLPITILLFFLLIGKSMSCVGTAGGILCMVQLIPLVGSIFLTEMALKKVFDRYGSRR